MKEKSSRREAGTELRQRHQQEGFGAGRAEIAGGELLIQVEARQTGGHRSKYIGQRQRRMGDIGSKQLALRSDGCREHQYRKAGHHQRDQKR